MATTSTEPSADCSRPAPATTDRTRRRIPRNTPPSQLSSQPFRYTLFSCDDFAISADVPAKPDIPSQMTVELSDEYRDVSLL